MYRPFPGNRPKLLHLQLPGRWQQESAAFLEHAIIQTDGT